MFDYYISNTDSVLIVSIWYFFWRKIRVCWNSQKSFTPHTLKLSKSFESKRLPKRRSLEECAYNLGAQDNAIEPQARWPRFEVIETSRRQEKKLD